jgi:putative ABC transport system permease protein
MLIPVTTFVNTYGIITPEGWERSVNVTVHARTPELVDEAILETRQVLRRMRGVKPAEEDNFTIFNSESTIADFNRITRGVKIGAFVIGTIALVVAGIGIMNIMLVSVTERTKEIGIRKSIGARPRDILRQFLLEAVVLCNIGGVIGVVLGFAFGNALVKGFMSPTFEAAVPAEWAVIGLVFCSAVGVAFGMLPAVKASRLNPIDALRYE